MATLAPKLAGALISDNLRNAERVDGNYYTDSALTAVHPLSIYHLVAMLDLEHTTPFDNEIRDVVLAAKLLGLVWVYRNTLILTQHGRKLSGASLSERKTIWKKSLFRLPLFRELARALDRSPDRTIKKEILVERFKSHLTNGDCEATFETLLSWGIYSEALSWDEKLKAVGLKCCYKI